MRDLLKSLVTLAELTPAIAGLVQGRVYGNEIPRELVEAESTRHPKPTLVIRQGGGGAKADILPLTDSTIITLCYGPTDHDADEVRRAVAQRFTLLDRELVEDVLIHHINPTGGPIPSVEPDLVWPAVAQSYTVKADILEVT